MYIYYINLFNIHHKYFIVELVSIGVWSQLCRPNVIIWVLRLKREERSLLMLSSASLYIVWSKKLQIKRGDHECFRNSSLCSMLWAFLRLEKLHSFHRHFLPPKWR